MIHVVAGTNVTAARATENCVRPVKSSPAPRYADEQRASNAWPCSAFWARLAFRSSAWTAQQLTISTPTRLELLEPPAAGTALSEALQTACLSVVGSLPMAFL
ncbi:hypothetical protein WJX74_001709 [Apatococcus lobatus]|uniref:Uncharacterized protein n=1 Tax=Apatococcus lobatus TaxID=904363 RepID=A0AAW1QTS5_9CHLO